MVFMSVALLIVVYFLWNNSDSQPRHNWWIDDIRVLAMQAVYVLSSKGVVKMTRGENCSLRYGIIGVVQSSKVSIMKAIDAWFTGSWLIIAEAYHSQMKSSMQEVSRGLESSCLTMASFAPFNNCVVLRQNKSNWPNAFLMQMTVDVSITEVEVL